MSETSREYENISLKVPPILLYMPLLHPGLTIVTAFFLECLKHRCQNYVQNSAARLVKRVKRTDYITPHLLELHWLPVFHRVKFKLLLLTYKDLNGLAPVYISDLLSYYQPSRALRSADLSLLDVPATRPITCGDRAFSVAAPKVWNGLPQYLRKSTSLTSFKSQLKTFLFKDAFSIEH